MSRLLPGLVGSSSPTRALRRAVEVAARLDAPVGILDPEGVDRLAVAVTIHAASRRRLGPFVVARVGAPLDTEEELFGLVRGAALSERPGAFERAERGTLFLDGVDRLPEGLQGKVLAALETRRVARIGSPSSAVVDVRVIAASSVDLRATLVRADLRARLGAVPIRIRPLRERLDDVPELACAIVSRLAAQRGRGPRRIARSAFRHLVVCAWRSGLAGLRETVARACSRARGESVELGDLLAVSVEGS